MQKTTREEPNSNPVVSISITVMALTAMLILAFNFFIKPDRATNLNPVGKQGTRSTAPQTTPPGAMNGGNSSTTPTTQ